MTIQYASDLHLEFRQNRDFLKTHPLRPVGDVLLLAGDILPLHELEKYTDFFAYISDHFKVTYWIPGNHEYYYFDLANKSGVLNETIKSNIHLVNNLKVERDGIRFIFSTLWSKIDPIHQWQTERSITDFHAIKHGKHFLSAELFNQLHEESLSFITSELSNPSSNKTVVVTHHVPTLLNYPQEFKESELNGAFVADLTSLIAATQPHCWIYGHHHRNISDFKIVSTLMLTNQLGYVSYGEHTLFNAAKALIP